MLKKYLIIGYLINQQCKDADQWRILQLFQKDITLEKNFLIVLNQFKNKEIVLQVIL